MRGCRGRATPAVGQARSKGTTGGMLVYNPSLYVGKVLLRAISSPASEVPSCNCDLPPRVSGEAPCRGPAETRHGRRVEPFSRAGLGPAYQHGRPAATCPERMRGHQGPDSIQA